MVAETSSTGGFLDAFLLHAAPRYARRRATSWLRRVQRSCARSRARVSRAISVVVSSRSRARSSRSSPIAGRHVRAVGPALGSRTDCPGCSGRMRGAQFVEPAGKALRFSSCKARAWSFRVRARTRATSASVSRLSSFRRASGRQRVAGAPGAARDGERAQRQRAGLGAASRPPLGGLRGHDGGAMDQGLNRRGGVHRGISLANMSENVKKADRMNRDAAPSAYGARRGLHAAICLRIAV